MNKETRLYKLLHEFMKAFNAGALEINSETIFYNDPDILPHPWHEEWADAVEKELMEGLPPHVEDIPRDLFKT